MIRSSVSGHFVPSQKGDVFVLCREPMQRASDCVLIVPSFAEEMNKSRSMVTDVALRMAERGVASVMPDLYGTGDSGGDFSEGEWGAWQHDLARTLQWARERVGPVKGILAIRLGCALAAAAIASGASPAVHRTVLWQPVFNGRRFLDQFLRVRIAASLMEQDRRETMAEIRSRLQDGEIVEVAGYRLSGRLAADLGAVAPPPCLPKGFGEVHWMEVVRDCGAPLPAPSIELIQNTRAGGVRVEPHSVLGEPFWASTEIVRIPELVAATVDVFAPSDPALSHERGEGKHH